MFHTIKKHLKKVFSRIARALVDIGIIRKEIIIRMDGGICSQMHFYIAGQQLQNNGNIVKYDLQWFRTVGVDLDGKFCRNFDILKLYPKLKLEEETSKLLKSIYISCFYKRLDYFSDEDSFEKLSSLDPPIYIDGYFRDSDETYAEMFKKTFKIDFYLLDNENKTILNSILNCSKDTCAIHVRRGDLAKYNPVYGDPIDITYFLSSIGYIIENTTADVKFYMFSDEPQWCRDTLLPAIGKIDIELCDINGSDRGYCDLALMSCCKHHITSQGSLGRYAALLRNPSSERGIVTLPSKDISKEWISRFSNAIII